MTDPATPAEPRGMGAYPLRDWPDDAIVKLPTGQVIVANRNMKACINSDDYVGLVIAPSLDALLAQRDSLLEENASLRDQMTMTPEEISHASIELIPQLRDAMFDGCNSAYARAGKSLLPEETRSVFNATATNMATVFMNAGMGSLLKQRAVALCERDSLLAQVAELSEVLSGFLADVRKTPELNMSNFDIDDVAELNSGMVDAVIAWGTRADTLIESTAPTAQAFVARVKAAVWREAAKIARSHEARAALHCPTSPVSEEFHSRASALDPQPGGGKCPPPAGEVGE